MNDPNFAQIVITALLSSGLVSGIMTLLAKKAQSPESKNDLARIGNEFAHQLLKEARTEREELRKTIDELEDSNATKQEVIEKLRSVAAQKDRTIEELEGRQILVARKLQNKESITLQDIFGPSAPEEFEIHNPSKFV